MEMHNLNVIWTMLIKWLYHYWPSGYNNGSWIKIITRSRKVHSFEILYARKRNNVLIKILNTLATFWNKKTSSCIKHHNFSAYILE